MSVELIRILGVPFRMGAQHPGSDNDAKGFRAAFFRAYLMSAGIAATDDGDLNIPSYVPRHSVPPIKNWPSPRIVWDLVRAWAEKVLSQPGELPLLLGCDGSIVVATVDAMRSIGDVHLIYIAPFFNDNPPHPSKCISAENMALWLLTNESPFHANPLPPQNVTVLGWRDGPCDRDSDVGSASLIEVQRNGVAVTMRSVLDAIPSTRNVLVHLDVSVIRKSDFPASYGSHEEGLALSETAEMLNVLLADKRVRLVEVCGYSAQQDRGGESAETLAKLLAGAWRIDGGDTDRAGRLGCGGQRER